MCGVAAAIGIGSAILGIGSQYMAYQQAKADTAFYNRQRSLEHAGALLQANVNRATEKIRSDMNKNFQGQVKDMATIAFHTKNTGITENQIQVQIKAAEDRVRDEYGRVRTSKLQSEIAKGPTVKSSSGNNSDGRGGSARSWFLVTADF